MNKKIITACAAALLMAACAGAWLAYHHANPKTDCLAFEYGDPLDIEAKTLIRSPDPAIADTVEIDLSAIEREEDGTAAAGSWDASFTYTDVFGTHTCPLTICISDTAAPSFLKLPERITLAPGNADHDFSADIEIWDLSECSLEIDSSMVDFDQPGEYILFATAVDRYDNQRSRSIRLTISEAQDTPTFIASSEAVTDIDPVLQRMVEAYLSAHAGGQEHWSLMVMDAENAAAIVSVNSAVQQSASLMKLFVMGAVYDRYDSLSALWSSAVIDDLLERMITDALQIEQYDFASLVYVRELLEIEAVKLCARNRTVEDLAAIEAALKECEEKFYTDERVSKDFAYHQALARGAHNPVIASLLLVITPDVLRYYQRYRVCSVPSEEVCFEHRELLRCVREQDEEGAAEMLRRHLKSLREFAVTNNDENHFLE